MKKLGKFTCIAGLSLAAGMICGNYLNNCNGGRTPCDKQAVAVDTVTYVDTIPYCNPMAKSEIRVGTKVAFLPVFIHAKDSLSENIPESGNNDVENIPDSVAVEIPITQREYEEEEYHAWVSGYEPQLDSIYVFPRHEVVTIKQTPKRKRWGIGIFAGYGYTPHGFQPCAGISINYNLWVF